MALMVLWHGNAISRRLRAQAGDRGVDAAVLLASVLCVFASGIECCWSAGRCRASAPAPAWWWGARWCATCTDGPPPRRLMSHVSMAFALGPAIAPFSGGWIFPAPSGWRAVFVFLALLVTLVLAALTVWKLDETHPPTRHPLHPARLARRYWGVFTPPGFPAPHLCGELQLQRFLPGHVLSAPVFLIHHLGLPETGFGWFFIPTVAA